ncbi:bifunctional tRNA pseudouridine(32) synthase/23S rRNA pseudouridine(746) synthase RluA [Colwellia sp. 1_MG-2023]|uniref:bifunctional tRNA pseudouridine(32) synthase/23S rRNA pseudouridine(746) synthase RluA n=1 Tax=Colwellia sp. 1_MG-2023 TaxID=3062649 RepID=UPI0026E442DE|nr:bifunctional tRNA pseudouridine(32) synthase/23S rRNA pseudouridine(746) synthase RluA [Colwellia sp. 1_MG-2023]MDO6447326.1 bifunctional tRNA pseudouridine(32) synthase/23S rRNA pseudouridine(746) synthase RluA [Colwellia sp. 1_MG-2023]
MTPYLDIVYQDDDLVVLNKPSGLLTVPGRLAEHKDCLQNRVQKVLPTATIVHRLDMATSGIILMALNKPAHVEISRQFEKRQTQKSYIARVYGKVESQTGSVDEPLICDWPNRPKQKVDHQHGKKSLTHYRVLSYQENSTLVELTPVTGRSHQLRVHMLSLGHPILGDRLYAHDKALTISPRLQLHAQWLTITHPVTTQTITFNAMCPFN